MVGLLYSFMHKIKVVLSRRWKTAENMYYCRLRKSHIITVYSFLSEGERLLLWTVIECRTEHSQQPWRGRTWSRCDWESTSRHGRCRSQHQRDETSTRERRQSSRNTESSLWLGRRWPHHPRRSHSRGLRLLVFFVHTHAHTPTQVPLSQSSIVWYRPKWWYPHSATHWPHVGELGASRRYSRLQAEGL